MIEVKRFICKGTWTPPNGREAALNAFINAIENNIKCKATPIRSNLYRKERRKALTTQETHRLLIRALQLL